MLQLGKEPSWLSPAQANAAQQLRRRLLSSADAVHQLSGDDRRFAEAVGVLPLSGREEAWHRAPLGSGGAVALGGLQSAFLPAQVHLLKKNGKISKRLLKHVNARSVRKLSEDEVAGLAAHRHAWSHALQSGWQWLLVLRERVRPETIRALTAAAPSVVAAAAAHEPQWQLLALSPVNSKRFFRVCSPKHIEGLRDLATRPFGRPVKGTLGWERIAPTLDMDVTIYRRELMQTLLRDIEARSPPFNAIDVWIFQALAMHSQLDKALAPTQAVGALAAAPSPNRRARDVGELRKINRLQRIDLPSSQVNVTGRRAWVTLLTGNSVNYTGQAMVQARSVRRFSFFREHISFVTPQVRGVTRERLKRAGSTVIEVGPIRWSHMSDKVGKQWQLVFTKLHIFNLTGYTQVAFLDADMFIANRRADNAFLNCDEELCGVRDHVPAPNTKRWMINAGLLVVRPSVARFTSLLKAMEAWHSPGARLPEQEFLSVYYNVTRTTMSPLVGVLPARFNSCRHTIKALRPGGHPRMLDNDFIVHHCAGFKLDRLPLCIWAPRRKSAGHCNSSHVRLFQRLYLRDHPCALHGRNAPFCQADYERCHWCTGLVRCVEKDTSCEMNSASTKALLHRVGKYTFGGQQAWKGDLRDIQVNAWAQLNGTA